MIITEQVMDQLKQWKINGHSYYELAKLSGVKETTISNWLTGPVKSISDENWRRIEPILEQFRIQDLEMVNMLPTYNIDSEIMALIDQCIEKFKSPYKLCLATGLEQSTVSNWKSGKTKSMSKKSLEILKEAIIRKEAGIFDAEACEYLLSLDTDISSINHDNDINISEKLLSAIKLCVEQNGTPYKFHQMTGISETTIYKWMSGKATKISVITLLKLLPFLDDKFKHKIDQDLDKTSGQGKKYSYATDIDVEISQYLKTLNIDLENSRSVVDLRISDELINEINKCIIRNGTVYKLHKRSGITQTALHNWTHKKVLNISKDSLLRLLPFLNEKFEKLLPPPVTKPILHKSLDTIVPSLKTLVPIGPVEIPFILTMPSKNGQGITLVEAPGAEVFIVSMGNSSMAPSLRLGDKVVVLGYHGDGMKISQHSYQFIKSVFYDGQLIYCNHSGNKTNDICRIRIIDDSQSLLIEYDNPKMFQSQQSPVPVYEHLGLIIFGKVLGIEGINLEGMLK
jgi:transcriptional regulator with XRE-family HTH domain